MHHSELNSKLVVVASINAIVGESLTLLLLIMEFQSIDKELISNI